MNNIIKIIKLVYSFRRNPFLWFSGLLVSSGCLLLSGSFLEILVNYLLSITVTNERNVNVNNTLSGIIGAMLILLGVALFYYKFLRVEPSGIEYKNDTNVIIKIFTEITSLNKLDFFIDQALYPYLINSSLEEWEALECYVQSSHYHVYNEKLKELLQNFFIAWSNVCKYWEAFTPTNVPDKLRPNTWMDIARTDDVAIAIKEVPEAAKVMHRDLQSLLAYIRNTYKDIGL